MICIKSKSGRSYIPQEPFQQSSRKIYNLRDSIEVKYPKRNCVSEEIARNRFQSVFKKYGFSGNALPTLYAYLGKGNKEAGAKVFYNHVRNNRITIERVGFRKNWTDKFFVIINNKIDIGFSRSFYIALSPRGTLRGALRNHPGMQCFDTRYDEDLSQRIPKGSPVSRTLNKEGGVQIVELGGETLFQAKKKNLSKPDRMIIYCDLIKAISLIHENGFVHGDLKSDNVVLRRDPAGKISGVLVIDLQGLTPFNAPLGPDVGTEDMFSPERRMKTYEGPNEGDDIWAFMHMICEIELSTPPESRLLSTIMLNQFAMYRNRLEKKLSVKNFLKEVSLFDPPGSNPRLLDHLIFNMARICREERPNAVQIQNDLLYCLDEIQLQR